jgi:outer membrane beta-barrel protein
MVTRLGIGLLGGLMALMVAVPSVWGEEAMDFSTGSEEGEADEGADAGEGGEMDWSAEGGAEGEEGQGGEGQEGGSDFLSDIGSEEQQPGAPEAVPETAEGGAAASLEPPEVWAVQRVYALRYRRWEIIPRFGFSMNDQFVTHYSFDGQVNWYITDVLALGLEVKWFYLNTESDVNYYTQRSFRVSVPISEYLIGLYLNFSYVPIYGKFAIFNRWILHWDTFIIGGLGVTTSRPIAVIDAEFREFDDWNWNITFDIGLGGRIFLRRWLAIFAEVRLYGFPQSLESRTVAPLADCNRQENCPDTWADQRANPNTWTDEDGEFAVNVMTQIGISIFLPPTFEYQLPL